MADPVRIELPVPFPLRTVNAWLLPGDRPALVDCGIGDPDVYRMMLEAVREHVDPAAVRLYLTHGHVDHAGNARRLRDDFGVPLTAPREEAPFVETFRADSERRNDEFAHALRAHGMPEATVARIRGQSDAIDAHLDDCPIEEPLPDPADLVLGDHSVHAWRAPGHTPGSTLYRTDEWVLTGDTLLETITSNAVELRDTDRGMYHRYVQQVEAMRDLVDLTALPGHHAPFRITDGIIDEHLDRHRQRRRRILSLLDRPKTAWQVFPELFPGLDRDPHYFMGMAEIVGHLHSLEIDGEVRREDEDGMRRFVAS